MTMIRHLIFHSLCVFSQTQREGAEMDALPFSRLSLRVLGILFFSESSVYPLCYTYFVRCTIILTYGLSILLQVYNVAFKDTTITIPIIGMGLHILELWSYVSLLMKGHTMDRMMKQATIILTEGEIKSVKCYDKRSLLSKLVYVMACVAMTMTYMETATESVALKQLTTGFNVQDSPTMAVVLELVRATFMNGFLLFTVLMQSYVSVMKVAVVVASHIESRFTRRQMTTGVSYDQVLKSLQHYNDFMADVNENMGVLPFSVFAIHFIFFSGGVSFVVVDGTKFASGFFLVCLAAVNVLLL